MANVSKVYTSRLSVAERIIGKAIKDDINAGKSITQITENLNQFILAHKQFIMRYTTTPSVNEEADLKVLHLAVDVDKKGQKYRDIIDFMRVHTN